MTTIKIKHRYTGAVLYECEAPDGMESVRQMRHALEKAAAAKADLSYADLSYADLRGSDLSYADLRYADLRDSDLCYADLSYADLRDSDLSYADLSYADLRYADLRDSDLCYADLSYADLRDSDLSYADLSYADLRGSDLGEGKKLVGDRPVLTIGPIGSRDGYLTAYLTESGVYVRAGRFFDTLDLFVDAVLTRHGDNKHGREYLAAVELIKAHAAIWMPENEVQP